MVPLDECQIDAVMGFVARVRRNVPADLEHVVLFGSRARGSARPDSDVDLLLIFRALPPDREPQATQVERIAEEVERRTGVPLGPWSVSLIDLRRGLRTPMLVDALTDGFALWPDGTSVPRVRFTPADALRCSGALLERVAEGSEEAERRLRSADAAGAVRRARDDIVRLCTAALLLVGETRPRRGEAVERFVRRFRGGPGVPREFLRDLRWAATSFGPRGDDEGWQFGAPPDGFGSLAALIDRLTSDVERVRERLWWRVHGEQNTGRRNEYEEEHRSAGRPGGPGHPPSNPEAHGP